MYKAIVVITAALAMAGCSTTRDRDLVVSRVSIVPAAMASVQQPVVIQRAPPVVREAQAPSRSVDASLQPGRNYVSAFPEADRRAACERLEYKVGTRAFARCMEGNFPENPYFAQAGN